MQTQLSFSQGSKLETKEQQRKEQYFLVVLIHTLAKFESKVDEKRGKSNVTEVKRRTLASMRC